MNPILKIDSYEQQAHLTTCDSYLSVVSILITDEKIKLIRWIIEQNPSLLIAREAKARCFRSCNSLVMGKILFPSGTPLDNIESSIQQDKIKQLLTHANLDLINFFTKRGVKPQFIINRPKAPLIGFLAEDPYCIIDRYRITSHLKTALYEAIEEKAEDDFFFAAGVHFYSEHGDEKGLRKFFEKKACIPSSFDWERPIQSSITNCQNRTLDLLLTKAPKDTFSEATQQKFVKLAVKIGVRSVVLALIRHGYEKFFGAEDLPLIEGFRAWCVKCEAQEIAILSRYIPPERSLSLRHQNLYGGIYAKEEFKKGTILSVGYAMWAMSQKKSNLPTLSFRDLLEALGCRRRHIAFTSSSQKSRTFGLLRKERGWTPLKNIYSSYLERTASFKPVYFALNGAYVLLTNKGFYARLQCLSLFHEYMDFWKEADPLFMKLEELFLKCVTTTFKDGEELRIAIANFHWLFSNIVPYERGSAAIGEVLTDAMWLLHGYLPGQLPKGKSLDLEALFSSKVEDFIALYPMGSST